MKYRKSKQRDRILELLSCCDHHPTADWIYQQLKPEIPSLSLGTVYRNLAILREQGLVDKLDFGSSFDRFELKKHLHYHLVCEVCGAVMDLDIPVSRELDRLVPEQAGFQISHHRLEFFGRCSKCR